MTPADQLGAVQDAVRLMGFLPYLQKEVDGMAKAVENRVFTSITQGTFSPDQAYQAWLEVHAMKRMVKRLETQVKVGQSQGAKATPYLEGEPPNPYIYT